MPYLENLFCMVVVIDGPSGSCKSSTAKAVASATGFKFLDSGAFYRIATLIYREVSHKRDVFFERLKRADIKVRQEKSEQQFILDGSDVSKTIRGREVTAMVSQVAADPEVRDAVTAKLRQIVAQDDFIADGRDLGTVVFPDAKLKFFMIADLEVRALRRFQEMQRLGLDADLNEIRSNLAERDHIDSNRAAAPLKKAAGAIEIDTSALSFDDQVQMVVSHINQIE